MIYGQLPEKHLMVIKNISPELAAALQSVPGGKAPDDASLAAMQKLSEEQVKLLREQIGQISDSNKSALDAVVRAVQAARSGPSSVTINSGSKPSK